MKSFLMPAALAALALTSCKQSGGGFSSDDAARNNTSSRTYTSDVDRVWQCLQTTMKDLDLNVEKANHDALGGQVDARRATGEAVFVRVRSMSPATTSVDVAVDPGDRNMAQMIQDKVAEKLGADRPEAGVSMGSVVEGTYDNPLEECAGAAERALKALNLPVASREKHDIWTLLRSKHLDTIPVSVKLQRTAQDKTQAMFTVGTSPGDDNQLLANRLKKEFEAGLNQAKP